MDNTSDTLNYPWPSPPFPMAEFSKLNWKRNVEVFKQGDEKNEYWITAMVEELGEIAGAVKKLKRGFNQRELMKMVKEWEKQNIPEEQPSTEYFYELWKAKKIKKIAEESADLFGYFDLFCTKNEFNLWEAIKEKFNQVSDEMKAPEYKI